MAVNISGDKIEFVNVQGNPTVNPQITDAVTTFVTGISYSSQGIIESWDINSLPNSVSSNIPVIEADLEE